MPLPQRDMHKYLVLKWTEIASNLNSEQIENLNDIIRTVTNSPDHNNRNYVVISDKNPELYEEVWGMKLAEIASEQRRSRDRLISQIYGMGTSSRYARNVVRSAALEAGLPPEYLVDEDEPEGDVEESSITPSSYTMNISEDQIELFDYSGSTRVAIGNFNGESVFTDGVYGHAANSN